MSVPINEWKWKGLPGHLCVVSDCIFRLHTQVGDYKISTVGAYYPKNSNKKKMEEIGLDHHYETYVFKGDSMIEIDRGTINLKKDANNNPNKADELAEKMHFDFCLKYAGVNHE